MTTNTKFFCTCGALTFDVGNNFIEKCYLIQNYPSLADDMTAGTTLFVWGSNEVGQLGTNDTIHRSSPVQTVSAGSNWKSIDNSFEHTVAIKTDGTLWNWGCGANGRLGNQNVINQSSPVQTVSATTNWKQATTGRCHTLAIKTDGSLWGWGGNSSGQLGTQTALAASSPVQTVSAGTNWCTVSANGRGSAAIKTDGSLWTWGRNSEGQLGDNTSVFKSSPVQTVGSATTWKSVSTSGYHTISIRNDGSMWAWGAGSFNGRVGDGSGLNISSPVQIATTSTCWKKAIAIPAVTSMAIDRSGYLWSWGTNSAFDSLGQGGSFDIYTPRAAWFTQAFVDISAGPFFAAGIGFDGALWMWGRNYCGALGQNQSYAELKGSVSPVQTVAAGNSWRSISLGYNFVVALREEDE